jgi:hypothetical protein
MKKFLKERSVSLPLLERVRVEIYIPDPHNLENDKLLRSLVEEFTYTFDVV